MVRLTQAKWGLLMNEQATSGKTAFAFCAERGIDKKDFSTRRKQLVQRFESGDCKYVRFT